MHKKIKLPVLIAVLASHFQSSLPSNNKFTFLMKLRIVLAILFWFFPYCLLISKIAVFAVKTAENAISDANKEQDAHLKIELRKAKRKVKINEERRLIRKTLSANDAQFNESPKDFDLNKSPPRESENDIAKLTIFESSSIGHGNLHNKEHEQNVNIDREKVLGWSKGKAQDWRKASKKTTKERSACS